MIRPVTSGMAFTPRPNPSLHIPIMKGLKRLKYLAQVFILFIDIVCHMAKLSMVQNYLSFPQPATCELDEDILQGVGSQAKVAQINSAAFQRWQKNREQVNQVQCPYVEQSRCQADFNFRGEA